MPATSLSWQLATHLPMVSLPTHPYKGICRDSVRPHQSPGWPKACRGPYCDGDFREALFCPVTGNIKPLCCSPGSSCPFGGFLLPYQSGSSGEASGRMWGTCPAGCRWGNRCILGWRLVSAGGPGSHRCPRGGSRAVSKASN